MHSFTQSPKKIIQNWLQSHQRKRSVTISILSKDTSHSPVILSSDISLICLSYCPQASLLCGYSHFSFLFCFVFFLAIDIPYTYERGMYKTKHCSA